MGAWWGLFITLTYGCENVHIDENFTYGCRVRNEEKEEVGHFLSCGGGYEKGEEGSVDGMGPRERGASSWALFLNTKQKSNYLFI